MKYGLIGERLGHSFSREIHSLIGGYEYELCEIPKEKVEGFFTSADFRAINVTIPYKQTVIPYLAHIDDGAEAIGAVNTVVNRHGELWGYNTDYFGMKALAEHAGIELCGKKVAILGTGGTSRTAYAVTKALGACEILKVSRNGRNGAITYEELSREHGDVEIIINTTPVGMYPKADASPIDCTRFPRLSGVLDAVYNPLRTKLVATAQGLGIRAEGGLYMLVAQAVRASEIFFDTKHEGELTERIYRELLLSKENIVLTGMPSSGKSTVGRELARRLGREFLDTDEMIVTRAGTDIPTIFRDMGESRFRDIESECVKDAALASGIIIATGGGAVLRRENVAALRENGRIFFLDRDLELLTATADRPLAQDREALKKRYEERLPVYNATSDVRIEANGDIEDVAEKILGWYKK